MTLSQSDNQRVLEKIAGHWLLAGVLCILFSNVYEYFSHGVWSAFMLAVGLFPLILGTLPFFLLSRKGLFVPGPWCQWLWRTGVACLAVGSGVCGILEIYGTASPYTPVYWIAGGLALLTGAAVFIRERKSAIASDSGL